MNWNIPQSSGPDLSMSLGVGDQLFMVGANGSGKSALIQQLVSSNPNMTIRRISAHRQTWFESGSIDLTPRSRKDFDEQSIHIESQYEALWRDQNAQKSSRLSFSIWLQKTTPRLDPSDLSFAKSTPRTPTEASMMLS